MDQRNRQQASKKATQPFTLAGIVIHRVRLLYFGLGGRLTGFYRQAFFRLWPTKIKRNYNQETVSETQPNNVDTYLLSLGSATPPATPGA